MDVIGGFRHKGLEELYFSGKTRRIGAGELRKCARILQLLEVATKPEDINIAGFRFHRLQGNKKRWSVRVTANYRITFGWTDEGAVDIDYEDYH
jgi:proteic killer suppression protein